MDLFLLGATLAKIGLVVGVLLTLVGLMSLIERRVSGFMQCRYGPNRVGPFGLLQPLADGLKFLMKEDVVPDHVHRPVFVLAPWLGFTLLLTSAAVVPFGGTVTVAGRQVLLVIADVDVGVLLALAASSLGVYGLILAGWASNNNYSLLGGVRASAQLISYEISLGLSVVGVVIGSGTLNLTRIVEQQADGLWNVVSMPFGALVFLIAGMAEQNRVPFDLPEAESELVAGYRVEYSSMKFLMFYMIEYLAMIVSTALFVTLFLGGYAVPGFVADALRLEGNALAAAQVLSFVVKLAVLLVAGVWIRWTLPRFRYDQVMHIGWKILLPIALANVVLVGVLTAVGWIG